MKAWLSKVLESSRGAVRSLLETAGGRAALGTLALLVFLTIAGLLVLWPYGEGPGFAPSVSADTERAEVLSVSSEGCDLEAGPGCRRLAVRLESGPDADSRQGVTLAQDELLPDVKGRRNPRPEHHQLGHRPWAAAPPAQGRPG